MSTFASAPRAMASAPPGVAIRVGETIRRWAIPVLMVFALVYILLPIAVMILFSFNDPPGRV